MEGGILYVQTVQGILHRNTNFLLQNIRDRSKASIIPIIKTPRQYHPYRWIPKLCLFKGRGSTFDLIVRAALIGADFACCSIEEFLGLICHRSHYPRCICQTQTRFIMPSNLHNWLGRPRKQSTKWPPAKPLRANNSSNYTEAFINRVVSYAKVHGDSSPEVRFEIDNPGGFTVSESVALSWVAARVQNPTFFNRHYTRTSHHFPSASEVDCISSSIVGDRL